MELTEGFKLRFIYTGEKKDHQLAWFICIYLIMNTVNSMIQTTFGLSGTPLLIARIVIYAVILFFLIAGFFTLSKEEKLLFLGAEIAVGTVYFLSLVYGGGTQTGEWLIESIGIYVPLGIYAWAIDDKKNLYQDLLKASWWIFGISIIYSLRITTYDMHFGYSILLVILLHLNEATSGKKRYWLPLIVEAVLLFRLGSRGAVVSIGVFLALRIVTNSKSRYRFFYAGLLIAAAVGLMIAISQYGLLIYQYLVSKGMGSRTLYLLFSGQMASHDSGRMDLWRLAIEAIKRKPWLGWGIGGVTSQLHGHPYPHQLFLDLLCAFGVPIGILFSIGIMIVSIRALLKPVDKQKELMTIFFCIGFVSLMFSGTCFANYYFFLFLGLASWRRNRNLIAEANG